MRKNFIVPDEAVKYILYQRTGYQKLANIGLLRSLKKKFPFVYHNAVKFESIIRARKIKEHYISEVNSEYDYIADFLPKKCCKVMDIGCGVGGIDVLINQRYDNIVKLYLLDKTEINKQVFYKFNSTGAFYNSLETAKKMLSINGLSGDRITLMEARKDNKILVDDKMDLVISLLSWGHHYPVSVYLDEVDRILAPHGLLIMDVRAGTSGLDELQKRFSLSKQIYQCDKYRRMLFQR